MVRFSLLWKRGAGMAQANDANEAFFAVGQAALERPLCPDLQPFARRNEPGTEIFRQSAFCCSGELDGSC